MFNFSLTGRSQAVKAKMNAFKNSVRARAVHRRMHLVNGCGGGDVEIVKALAPVAAPGALRKGDEFERLAGCVKMPDAGAACQPDASRFVRLQTESLLVAVGKDLALAQRAIARDVVYANLVAIVIGREQTSLIGRQ